MERFEKGEGEVMTDILTNLRTLVGQRHGTNKGLIHSLADQYDLTGHVQNEKNEKVTFDEFLASVQLRIMGEPISNSDFVWKYGSQMAAHSDEGIDEIFAEAESFHVGGMSSVHRIVYGIAQTTRNVSAHLVQILENDGKRLEKQLKQAGKWK
jgi:hypothetical protein